jgi:uncharacterized protein (TIGR02246 family)
MEKPFKMCPRAALLKSQARKDLESVMVFIGALSKELHYIIEILGGDKMNDEKIASIMRDLIKSLETGDVEKTLSLFAEDGVLVNPDGTFKGKEELRRYLANSAQSMRDMTVTETGNKIIVQGNKAFYEHVIAATIEGKRAEGLAMCAYEFTNDKIQEVRTVYDRLLMAKQAAKGWFARTLVNLIVKQAEKGLH